MKKIFALTACLILIGAVANAQSIRLGAKAGANLNKVSGKAFDEEYDLGYHVGAFVDIGLAGKIGIQPEVLWNQVNTKRASGTDPVLNDWQDNTGDIQLNYLTIPVLLRFNVLPVLALQVGPQFGILLNKDENLWDNGRQAFKSGDFSLAGGASINLKALRVYGRYNIGLTNIKEVNNQDNWKSEQIQLGVAFSL